MNVAVIVIRPCRAGFQEQVAEYEFPALETTFIQPGITLPFAKNFTFPESELVPKVTTFGTRYSIAPPAIDGYKMGVPLPITWDGEELRKVVLVPYASRAVIFRRINLDLSDVEML